MPILHHKMKSSVAAILLAGALAVPSAPLGSAPDPTLQSAADGAMAGHPGALVVVDVSSGAILASVNLPLAAHGLERPGSTVKPFVLMALLEAYKVNPEERLLCKRPLVIGGARMDCTHSTNVTQLNADDAIAYSCNSYFAQVAPRLSALELVQTFRRAGFDSPSGLASGEATGHINKPATRAELQLEALGDAGIEVTPLELLEAYRKLALQRRDGGSGPVFDGLEHSVAYGMAHAVNVDRMKVAGKTGTASSARTPRTHGFFAGYAPADKPEIAVVVFIERGRGMDAAALAQPVFAEFARQAKKQ
jgi:cell division protein FtsI/penicillin-binding protein 2